MLFVKIPTVLHIPGFFGNENFLPSFKELFVSEGGDWILLSRGNDSEQVLIPVKGDTLSTCGLFPVLEVDGSPMSADPDLFNGVPSFGSKCCYSEALGEYVYFPDGAMREPNQLTTTTAAGREASAGDKFYRGVPIFSYESLLSKPAPEPVKLKPAGALAGIKESDLKDIPLVRWVWPHYYRNGADADFEAIDYEGGDAPGVGNPQWDCESQTFVRVPQTDKDGKIAKHRFVSKNEGPLSIAWSSSDNAYILTSSKESGEWRCANISPGSSAFFQFHKSNMFSEESKPAKSMVARNETTMDVGGVMNVLVGEVAPWR